MKRHSPGKLIVMALLLLSAGVVWQQQRRGVLSSPALAGAASDAALPSPTNAGSGVTTGVAGHNNSDPLLKSTPLATPAQSAKSTAGSPPVPRQDAPDTKPTNPMPLEPLISQTGKQSLIARDGTPLRIELSPGVAATAVDLQAWTDDQARNAAGQYDWRIKITVPAGGLLERVDPTAFTAPADDYGAEFDFAMDQDLPGTQWANSFGKSFFVHFNNDTYGLLNVQMVAGGAHFVAVKAWLNPATGSRNLQLPPPLPTKAR